MCLFLEKIYKIYLPPSKVTTDMYVDQDQVYIILRYASTLSITVHVMFRSIEEEDD